MAIRQNELPALRLLLAQRRMYKRAKLWANLRFIGFSVIGVGAPVVGVLWKDSATVLAAVAGCWIFLSRTVFLRRERGYAAFGAQVQEQFDLLVFGMPTTAARVPSATPEQISLVVGDDSSVLHYAEKERLKNWYSLDADLNGTSAVAICLRANAAYSERLLNLNANMWLAATLVWSILIVVLGLLFDLTFAAMLLSVALPLLPALLDVGEQWHATRAASGERRAMADDISSALTHQTKAQPLEPERLLVWQDQIYALRKATPQVPELLYRSTREKNERAMIAAAAELSKVAKERQ